MPAIEHAVIAAAGLGSRLGHGIPKCLVELGGRPLIEYQLKLLRNIPDVRVVVGYMEQSVMDAVRRVNDDAIFVRNPDYRGTTTQDSYALGAEGLTGTCLFLDADIVFEPESFLGFLRSARQHPLTIGVTVAKTDNAVYAFTRRTGEAGFEVLSFSSQPSEFEWANIVAAPASTFVRRGGPVFETLQTLLPLPATEIVSYEVDTESDLRRAREFFSGKFASCKFAR